MSLMDVTVAISPVREPIAIIGMGCRLPGGAHSPETFWQLLQSGTDAVSEIPAERWSSERFYDPDPQCPGRMAVRQAAFLQVPLDEMDWDFFGISPREAAPLDPQQRILLEITWEALEDAGLVAARLRGSTTGVYIGGFTVDNMLTQVSPLGRAAIGSHTSTSFSLTMLANRLSYTYDFRGPSLSVDTACSSSLVSLHLACQGLWSGDCDLALAGGVNVILRPEVFMVMGAAGFLAPDGRCKSFDESADGYGRGEGAGILVLKRLSEARAAGDRIHALIRATQVNQDGKTAGITVPNKEAQVALLREVLARAGVRPDQIHYVEAHGTGTQAGDRAEVSSLHQVLSDGRAPGERLWIGSVKTNIGHLEAAAGVASVIKTVLVLKHRLVPPNLHLRRPNPELQMERLVLRVPGGTETLPPEGPLFAGVNSFGYGGSNAHAVLESAPAESGTRRRSGNGPWVIPLSAQSPAALTHQARNHARKLVESTDEALADFAYTLGNHRSHLDERLVVVGASRRELAERLDRFASDGSAEGVVADRARPGRRLVFLYTGMGPQWFGMGRELMETEPVFRRALEECDRHWRPLAGWSLLELLNRDTGLPMPDPADAQPANLALQMGLTRLWEARGVRPAALLGHSVGEIAAAWAAGTVSLEEAVRLTYHRSQLQQGMRGHGGMLSLGLPTSEAERLASDPRLSLAAVNSSNSTVLAGDPERLSALQAELSSQGKFVRPLHVSVAYHSHQLDPLEPSFMELLSGLQGGAPRLPLYSTVTGGRIREGEQDTAYWWRNARQTVQLKSALERLIEDGYDLFLEIGPHPVLGSSVRECLSEAGVEGRAVSSSRRQEPDGSTLLRALAELYTTGLDLDWSCLTPRGRLMSLPAYPWARERVWHESEASRWDRLGGTGHPLLKPRPDEVEPTWEGVLNRYWLPYFEDHRIGGAPIFPGTGYVEAGLIAAARVTGRTHSLALEDLQFVRALPSAGGPLLQMRYEARTARFSIYSRPAGRWDGWTLHASGRVIQPSLGDPPPALPLDEIRERVSRPVSVDELYSALAGVGVEYGPAFRGLRRLWRQGCEVLAEIAPELSPDGYFIHPVWLDACLQCLFGALQKAVAYVPTSIRQVRLRRPIGDHLLCYGVLRSQSPQRAEADLKLIDSGGEVLAELLGLRLTAVGSAPVESAADGALEAIAYGLSWREADPEPADAEPARSFLVVGPPEATRPLLESLAAQNGSARGALSAAEASELLPKLAPPVHLVYHAGGQGALQASRTCAELLTLVRALAALPGHPRLTVVTAGAHQVTGRDSVGCPSQGAVWGFLRAAFHELPHLALRLVDLDPTGPDPEALMAELTAAGQEPEVAWRGGTRYVGRLTRLRERQDWGRVPSRPGMPFLLRGSRQGTFDSLEYQETRRRPPGPREVEVAVKASAVNFKDVMKVLNLLPDPYLDTTYFGEGLGMEIAGTVVGVGEEMTGFKLGDPVVAIGGSGGFASFVTSPDYALVRKSSRLSFEQSVQLINFCAAYRGLVELARLGQGETVLIHGGAGGVGLAAIQVARRCGATVFATAGTEERREYLRSYGAEYVSDSRSLRFYDDVRAWTGGRGVDVVLNSLSGDYLAKSLELLTPEGRFVEIGKRDIAENNSLGLGVFSRNQMFAALDLDLLIADHPAALHRLLLTVQQLLDSAELEPVPTSIFPAHRVVEALRLVAQTRHIGKVVVSMEGQTVPVRPLRSARDLREDGTYLVTGGFGGFGMEVTRWLCRRGARHLVVLSRQGASTREAKALIAAHEAQGGRIWAPTVDISEEASLAAILADLHKTMPPLRGILHAAAVLEDGTLSTLSQDQLERVMAPKAAGAWHLHRFTEDLELDFFVLFSSASAVLGNPGQANYCAANAFLDALAHHRRARGLPAIAIDWGSLAEVGMVAQNATADRHLARLGMRALPVETALRMLEWALECNLPQVAALDMDWAQWARAGSAAARSPRNAELVAASTESGEEGPGPGRSLLTAAPEDRLRLAQEFLTDQISRIMRLPPDRIEGSTALDRLGVDSLLAVELVNAVRTQTGVELPAMSIQQATVADLAAELCRGMPTKEDQLLEQLDTMSEAELDELLMKMSG
ncbi:MAG: type I polyketide synthase [Armatimonadetes bacterium]|nr:type I polyketide synthase [Armatimonadota bacterium]